MTVDEHVAKTLWHGSYGEKLRQQVREQGAVEGRERLLVALIQDRFGPHPEVTTIAHRLVTQLDDAAAVHAITTATGLADLVKLRRSTA